MLLDSNLTRRVIKNFNGKNKMHLNSFQNAKKTKESRISAFVSSLNPFKKDIHLNNSLRPIMLTIKSQQVSNVFTS